MLEKEIQKRILKYLRTLPKSVWFKIPAGPWSAAGIPDIIGCYHGQFVAFEVKSQTGRLTKLQKYTMNKIYEAGGTAEIVRSVKETKEVIKK